KEVTDGTWAPASCATTRSSNPSGSTRATLSRTQPLFELLSENPLGPLRNHAGELHEFAGVKMGHQPMPTAMGGVVKQHEGVRKFLGLRQMLEAVRVIIRYARQRREWSTVADSKQNTPHI